MKSARKRWPRKSSALRGWAGFSRPGPFHLSSLVGGVMAFGLVFFPPFPSAGAHENEIVGKQLYEERCVLCHGAEGQGWDWKIKANKPPVPVPNLSEVVPKRSNDYLVKVIKGGGQSVGLTLFMPAFGFNLREQQVWDLVAFLRAMAAHGPKGFSRREIPDRPDPGAARIGRAYYMPQAGVGRGRFQLVGAAAPGVFSPLGPGRGRVDPPGGGALPGRHLHWTAPRWTAPHWTVEPSSPWRWLPPQPGVGYESAPQAGRHPLAADAGHSGKAGSRRTGFFPHAVALADLNGDGNPDLLIPAAAARKLTVLLTDGKGGIISNHDYPVGIGPTWVDTADFNGDGHVDVVVTNTGGDSLTLYYGDGKGGLKERRDIPGIQGPACVVVLDVDGDGLPDLAVTQPAQSRVAILRNDSSGVPKLRTTIAVDRGPHIMDKADLNKDGYEDLIVGSLGAHTLTILPGKGDGTFAEAFVVPVGRFPHYRVYADFNGDGHLDAAVVVAGEDAVNILLGDGTGNLKKTASVRAGVNPHGLAGGDVNGDGHMDLIITNRSSKDALVMIGDGKGGFSARPSFVTGQDVITLASHDFDGDGKLDLAMISASSNEVIFFKGHGDASFTLLAENE